MKFLRHILGLGHYFQEVHVIYSLQNVFHYSICIFPGKMQRANGIRQDKSLVGRSNPGLLAEAGDCQGQGQAGAGA